MIIFMKAYQMYPLSFLVRCIRMGKMQGVEAETEDSYLCT